MINAEGRHPSIASIAPFFEYEHLSRPDMRSISRECHDLAQAMVDQLPDSPELAAGLRKLLEAKDCLVRAALVGDGTPIPRRPRRGMIVDYTLSEGDVAVINSNRIRASADHEPDPAGRQVHRGNRVTAGDVYPMVITRTWGDTPESAVNGQVLLDGNDLHWVTSVSQGDGERRWRCWR